MHPDFLQQFVNDHQRELEARNRRRFTAEPDAVAAPAPAAAEGVLLRLCCVGDDPALERLAQLEGRPTPTGRQIVAEVDGALVAALPLAGGAPLADPFKPTAHLLPLLELRARQLDATARGGWWWGAVRAWSRA
jgi:hypothetical protein